MKVENEQRLLMDVFHPNICRLYDCYQDGKMSHFAGEHTGWGGSVKIKFLGWVFGWAGWPDFATTCSRL